MPRTALSHYRVAVILMAWHHLPRGLINAGCVGNCHSMCLFTRYLPLIAVYDITKRSTFANLQKWIEEVRRYTASNVLIILIGNKCDLEAEREVDFEEARQMCQYIPEILFVMETSAKENTNVEDAFRCLATELKVISMIIQKLGIFSCPLHSANMMPVVFRPWMTIPCTWAKGSPSKVAVAHAISHRYLT